MSVGRIHPTKPCPFCGASPEHCIADDVVGNEGGDAWTVICERCGANGPLDTRKRITPMQAIHQWDNRQEPQPC